MQKRKGALWSVSLTLPDVTYDLDVVFDHRYSLNAQAELSNCLFTNHVSQTFSKKCQDRFLLKNISEGICGSFIHSMDKRDY